ncbi:hypothetical protein SAMD00020551_1521 [Mesobacillus selenatarsenatis SF-1]|uniref:Uncharacterized protein n=1 Tax=Mesobacillus selenatarsenatis (strain DSM 18680 / JCM 14380 / FERM P-15431 / SF-1) TaxID=1321606 RepID=A0A0A8X2C4_MESS1|nr:hypothetical protein SAMD00020551_1521 [Mesobacillus selenatarsenatis SF-1]
MTSLGGPKRLEGLGAGAGLRKLPEVIHTSITFKFLND